MTRKRVFDISVSLVALIVSAPIFLVAALAIRLESRGPALFFQTRVGQNAEPFLLVKLRTMHVRTQQDSAPFEAGRKDRITRVGGILRSTKLDELPQFWNVLVGDMSVVGPRPEVPEWTAVYVPEWREVLRAKPGITDPASIEWRHEEEVLSKCDDPNAYYHDVVLPRKLKLYRQYVETQSLSEDIRIIGRTAASLVRGRQ